MFNRDPQALNQWMAAPAYEQPTQQASLSPLQPAPIGGTAPQPMPRPMPQPQNRNPAGKVMPKQANANFNNVPPRMRPYSGAWQPARKPMRRANAQLYQQWLGQQNQQREAQATTAYADPYRRTF